MIAQYKKSESIEPFILNYFCLPKTGFTILILFTVLPKLVVQY